MTSTEPLPLHVVCVCCGAAAATQAVGAIAETASATAMKAAGATVRLGTAAEAAVATAVAGRFPGTAPSCRKRRVGQKPCPAKALVCARREQFVFQRRRKLDFTGHSWTFLHISGTCRHFGGGV